MSCPEAQRGRVDGSPTALTAGELLNDKLLVAEGRDQLRRELELLPERGQA